MYCSIGVLESRCRYGDPSSLRGVKSARPATTASHPTGPSRCPVQRMVTHRIFVVTAVDPPDRQHRPLGRQSGVGQTSLQEALCHWPSHSSAAARLHMLEGYSSQPRAGAAAPQLVYGAAITSTWTGTGRGSSPTWGRRPNHPTTSFAIPRRRPPRGCRPKRQSLKQSHL